MAMSIFLLFCLISPLHGYLLPGDEGWRAPVYKEHVALAEDWSKVGVWIEKTFWSHKDAVIQVINDTISTLSREESSAVSPTCRRSLQAVATGLYARKLWAFQMLDASSLANSGFIHRYIDLGDYDSCLEVTAPEGEFIGQHCLLELDFALPPPDRRHNLDRVNLTGSSMSGTWLERCTLLYKYLYFQRITNAVCVPSTCQAKEIQLLFNKVISRHAPITAVLHEKCDTRVSRKYVFSNEPLFRQVSITILSLLVVTTIVATLLASLRLTSERTPLLNHFDGISSSRRLLADTSDPIAKRLAWIHGARVMYIVMAISFHVVLGAIWTPYTHVKYTNSKAIDFPLLNEFSSNMTVGITINFVIGGMLAFISWYPELKRKGHLSFSKYVVGRWLRTFPLIAGVILIIFSVPESLGSGPAWRDGWNKVTKNCLKNWWAEFAYISNHWDFRESCLAHAWYMGADFQLYVCSFFIILLFYHRPRIGITVTTVMIVFSIVFQAWYLESEQLNPVCDYNTTDFDRLFTREALLHTRAFNYIPSYLIGIVLGFLIVNGYTIKNKTIQKIGWFVFVTMGLLVHLIPMNWKSSGGRPSRWIELTFGSLQRTMYSLAFAYRFFVGSNGEAGICHPVLEAKVFLPLGRMSFSIFIGHFLIIWWDVFNTRNLFEFRAFDIVSRLTYTSIFSVFMGYAIYLVFEAPFISYGKSLALRKKIECKSERDEEEETVKKRG